MTAEDIQHQTANQLTGDQYSNSCRRSHILISADTGEDKNDPSKPCISVHQRTLDTSSPNPAIPCLNHKIETKSTIPTSEFSNMAMRMVEEVWVMRTISVFWTTRPIPAAIKSKGERLIHPIASGSVRSSSCNCINVRSSQRPNLVPTCGICAVTTNPSDWWRCSEA